MDAFFVTYLILIIVSGFFCNGIFEITRGTWVELPDGTFKTEGEIFGFWQRFWEQETGSKKIYYKRENIETLYTTLILSNRELAGKFTIDQQTGYWFYADIGITDEEQMPLDQIEIERLLNCKFEVYNNYYVPYIEETVYRFPAWVRKPLSECVTCMASVYGSFIWGAFTFLQKDAFLWAENKYYAYFVFWFIFIVSLSWWNIFLSKKNE